MVHHEVLPALRATRYTLTEQHVWQYRYPDDQAITDDVQPSLFKGDRPCMPGDTARQARRAALFNHWQGLSHMSQAEIAATVVWLKGPRELELRVEALDARRLQADEILCQTIVTAISPGTELAAYTGMPPLRDQVAYPRLLGYCNIARVLAAGAAVKGVRVDDRVLSFASHRSHFILAERDVLARIADTVPAADAVCAYLFHLGYNAVIRTGVRAGARVAVIGLGVLGLTSVAMAAVAGSRVWAVSDQPGPGSIARRFGAEAVLGRVDAGKPQQLPGGVAPDVVITTSNRWADWQLALQLAGNLGVIGCLGFPGRGQPACPFNPFDSQYFYAKQLRIESVGVSPELPDARGFLRYNERDNLQYLLDLIATGRLVPDALVSGSFQARDIERAYEDLLARKNSPLTYLLQWNQ